MKATEDIKQSPVKVLYCSAAKPDEVTLVWVRGFIEGHYGTVYTLEWSEEPDISGGCRLEVYRMENGKEILWEVFNWSDQDKLSALGSAIRKAVREEGDIISLMKEAIASWEPDENGEEVGTVLSVGDGIVKVSGLPHVAYGEIVTFSSGAKAMVMDLCKTYAGCILFGAEAGIGAGDRVYRSHKSAGMPVGEAFLGRVVSALGTPLDGKGDIRSSAYYPVEKPAPGIIDRQPVGVPMSTGLLVIDSMFPIGRGQRELIIGDRQTGKTAIALDTILNQKGKDVVCIYVSIGQKASSVVQLVDTLKRHDAMDYSIVVSSTASDSASLQYIAPYAGCALGEYFMERGRDVLIVYDDLTKHAVAYRELSLLLGRAPGREAYPGDVFYLHSRLLERSARLSEEKGGGSMTALPVVETQNGDVSAYIPTNIISITDGQIFLESSLFFSGQRPAVNIGLSVSRVGGAAQTKAMKKAAGTLRLDLSQYREMEIFTQFSSDLDDVTRKQLVYGKGLMRLLRQAQYHPLKTHQQVIILVAALEKKLMDIKEEYISAFASGLVAFIEKSDIALVGRIEAGQLSDEDRTSILSYTDCFMKEWDK